MFRNDDFLSISPLAYHPSRRETDFGNNGGERANDEGQEE